MDATSPNALAGRKRAVAYDHSGVRAKGRCSCGVRDHGRLESIAGARLSLCEPGGLQNEYSGGLEAPRFSKQTFSGCDVMMENRFGQNVRNELTSKGHKMR